MQFAAANNRSRAKIQWTPSRRWIVQSVMITLVTWFGGPTPSAAQNRGNSPSGPSGIYPGSANRQVTETVPVLNKPNGMAVTGTDSWQDRLRTRRVQQPIGPQSRIHKGGLLAEIAPRGVPERDSENEIFSGEKR